MEKTCLFLVKSFMSRDGKKVSFVNSSLILFMEFLKKKKR